MYVSFIDKSALPNISNAGVIKLGVNSHIITNISLW